MEKSVEKKQKFMQQICDLNATPKSSLVGLNPKTTLSAYAHKILFEKEQKKQQKKQQKKSHEAAMLHS